METRSDAAGSRIVAGLGILGELMRVVQVRCEVFSTPAIELLCRRGGRPGGEIQAPSVPACVRPWNTDSYGQSERGR